MAKNKKFLTDDGDDQYEETIATFIDFEDGSVPRMADVGRDHVLYGDTDSSYISLAAVTDDSTPMEEVTEMGDYIGWECNEAFPAFMQNIFNVPDERKDIIATDREVISDKSLFIKKKKYVMHIVDNEGVKCDKIKSMGVDYVRSDTPVVVRKFLADMVEHLINGYTYEQTRDYILDFKKKFKKMGLYDIGWPKGIKKMVDYEEHFRETGDLFITKIGKDNKKRKQGFPQHVKAAIFWNASRQDSDNEIVAGDKIKIIHLRDEDYPFIAYPSERQNLPEWLTDLEVDHKAMWALVKKKIDIFLEPIGYDLTSRQVSAVRDSFEF